MLEQYLDEHKTELLHKSEAEVLWIDNELAYALLGLFPHGQMDKIHLIWARCLRDALCLGRTSEGKRLREEYSPQICTEMEQSISKAFIIGKGYAIEEASQEL